MRISIPTFQGMNTALDSPLINLTQSPKAKNCVVRRGRLESLKSNSVQASPTLVANVGSLFLYDNTHWFGWVGDVNAVNSTVAQDQYERVYFTGNGAPKYTNSSIATGGGTLPFSSYDLGLPAPSAPIINLITYYDQSLDLPAGDTGDNYPIENASGFMNIETADDETRFYVCTYVSAYGEESQPSFVSAGVELFYSKDTVTLNFADIGGFGNVNITRRRIYRTATGGETTEFFLVHEQIVGETNFVDNKTTSELGAELTTQKFVKPPVNMTGIIGTSTGVIIGFAGNEIIPSEPYLPYAYPLEYRQSLVDNVVALAEMSSGIVVATDNKPAIIQGISPDSYTVSTLDAALPCISKRSMVDMGDFAIYASHDGLVAVGGSSVNVITKEVLSREYWRTLLPETIHGYRYNNYYVAFYGDSSGFMFDISNGNYFELDFYANAGYFNTKTGELFLSVGNDFVIFDSGTNLNYLWTSKDVELSGDVLSCVKVRGENLENSTINIYVDGVLILSYTMNGNISVFRLPPFRADTLSFGVTGSGVIKNVTIASSMKELDNAN
jgi:hypothetical protein